MLFLKLNINGKQVDKPSVWWDSNENSLKMIDQTKIPFQVEVYTCTSFRATAQAIREMRIRGAPSIGAAAGYGLAQAVREFSCDNEFEKKIQEAYNILLSARPTAIDLKNGLDTVKSAHPLSPENALKKARFFANRIAEEGIKIGQYGKQLIKPGMNILTHCHTGALALVDHGSAMAPLIQAYNDGIQIHVFVDETRPRLQGRMTSWELSESGLNYTVICDSASGYLMSQGKINLVIVGADRVTQNGDIANKIGTYNLAVLAHYHNIPFYTAFPTSTYDRSTFSGRDIVIEERNSLEIKEVIGYSRELNKTLNISLYPDLTNFFNPAFDITPCSLISGYITPLGILSASELNERLKDSVNLDDTVI
ncbi:MAG: S-methyl-5-thioribose-1-phosphate isomerase [Candidatus Hodarchaeota archaeon]